MDKNIIIILSAFLFGLPSCNYKKYHERITAKKGTYWDVVRLHNEHFPEPLNSYYFGVNAECRYYSLKRSAGGGLSREIITNEPVKSAGWQMNADTLRIGFVRYLVNSNKNKRLLLTDLNNPADTMELMQSDIK